MKMQIFRILYKITNSESQNTEDLMTAEDRHIKSITVCKRANSGSSQPIVAYDASEDVCNDS